MVSRVARTQQTLVLPYLAIDDTWDPEVLVRITLIEPAAPGFHIYSFVKQYRLGLPLLGAILKQQGHEVRIYAESLAQVNWDDVLSSDLVGVSTTTSTAITLCATRVNRPLSN